MVVGRKRFPKVVQGHWTKQEQLWSTNTRELVAAERTVLAYLKWARLARCTVRLFTDNIVTLVYVNKMGGRYPHLREVANRLLRQCEERGVRLVAEHVPGTYNKIADALSRLTKDRSDWKLNQRIFRLLDTLWGPHTVDWFATRNNRQLPRFASWAVDAEATYVDALKNLHRRENGFANPPFAVIGAVAQKLRRTKNALTLIAPAWPAQHWWPLVLDLMVDVPILLPDLTDLFTPSEMRGVAYKPAAPPWGVIAFRLSGNYTKRNRFRKKCRRLLHQGGLQILVNIMNRFGGNGFSSPGTEGAIRSILLFLSCYSS